MDVEMCPTCHGVRKKIETKDGKKVWQPNDPLTIAVAGLEGLMAVAGFTHLTCEEKMSHFRGLSERIYRELTGQEMPWDKSVIDEEWAQKKVPMVLVTQDNGRLKVRVRGDVGWQDQGGE